MARKKKQKQEPYIGPSGFEINEKVLKKWRPVIHGRVIKKEGKSRLRLHNKVKGYLDSSAGQFMQETLKLLFSKQRLLARELKKSKADPLTQSYLVPFYYMKEFEVWVHKERFTWELVVLKKHRIPDCSRSDDI